MKTYLRDQVAEPMEFSFFFFFFEQQAQLLGFFFFFVLFGGGEGGGGGMGVVAGHTYLDPTYQPIEGRAK